MKIKNLDVAFVMLEFSFVEVEFFNAIGCEMVLCDKLILDIV